MKSAKNLLKRLNGGIALIQEEIDFLADQYFTLRVNSSVKYIGKKDKILKKDALYTVDTIFFSKLDRSGRFCNTWYEDPIPYVSITVYDNNGEHEVYSAQSNFIEVGINVEEKVNLELFSLPIFEKTEEQLNTLIQRAVRKEDYITAAKLRDEIAKRKERGISPEVRMKF